MENLRAINSLGENNKKKLRQYFSVKNIRSTYKIYGVTTQDEAYEAMANIYNQFVEQQKEIKKQEQKELRRVKREAEKKQKKLNEVKNSLVFSKTYDTTEVSILDEKKINEMYVDLKINVERIFMANRGKNLFCLSSINGVELKSGVVEVPGGFGITKAVIKEFIKKTLPQYVFSRGEYINLGDEDDPGISILANSALIKLMGESEEDYLDRMENVSHTYGKLSLFVGIEAMSQEMKQSYLDGKKHCVINPLLEMFQGYANNATTKESKRKLNKVVSNLKVLEENYKNGVPEEDMEIIGKTISRCIVIHDLLGGEVIKYNPKSTKKIHFTNTRKNHLDVGHITVSGTPIKVKRSEIEEIVKQHNEEEIFYVHTCDKNGVYNTVSSPKGNWVIVNDEYEIYNRFDKQIKKRGFGINSVEYPELNNFLKEGQIVNASPVAFCDEPNDLQNVKLIDVTKAYTQFKYCKYYQGFLGNIHQYSKLDVIKNPIEFIISNVGIYQVKITECDNWILNSLGIRKGLIYTLPSPEILMFVKEYGVKIKLLAGAYGTTRLDFEFPEYMLENRRYCTWSGKLGQDTNYNYYIFEGDEEWAKHLKHSFKDTDNTVTYFQSSSKIMVTMKKKSNYTYHHLFAFITSYTRLNVLNVMSKINGQMDGQLVKVILDGIYYKGTNIGDKTEVPCKESTHLKKHIGFTDGWYHPSIIDTSSWGEHDDTFNTNVILCGQGGSGKSHHVFNSKTLLKPLYVVPSHVLGRHFANKYKCNYITIHKLAGLECASYAIEKGYSPSCVFIDEITMVDRDVIYKAMCENPATKFILAGDVDENKWFQCRSGKESEYNEIFTKKYINESIKECNEHIQNYKELFKGESLEQELTSKVSLGELYKWADYKRSMLLNINNTLKFNYVYFETDRRAKDDELKEMKLFVRDCMDEVFTDGGIKDSYEISNMIRDKYYTMTFEEAINEFKNGDIFIAGTHKTNDLLLENNIVSGYITKEKELVFDFNVPEKCIKRGSFTTHSFQGFTIEDKKVFVVLDLFEYAMLYTSISRCVNFDQIILVEKPTYENFSDFDEKFKTKKLEEKKIKEQVEAEKTKCKQKSTDKVEKPKRKQKIINKEIQKILNKQEDELIENVIVQPEIIDEQKNAEKIQKEYEDEQHKKNMRQYIEQLNEKRKQRK